MKFFSYIYFSCFIIIILCVCVGLYMRICCVISEKFNKYISKKSTKLLLSDHEKLQKLHILVNLIISTDFNYRSHSGKPYCGVS